ncbi:S9 family peptidase [Oecophyllibacter saccharovorans]|uniref:S9 family peptidase n=1 Tax=Oecophyllibacter saccharovorans TaxID=2558360 RepID=UPI001167D636|nr:S9 family peptidase [Oecophyllibacter saccharovorans]TPW35174.1 S9 family peptidase [Oecophyllibacter saccharovorans]
MSKQPSSRLSPPVPKRESVILEQLGHTRCDPYAWMKDPDWQQVLRDPGRLRPDIREHLEAENAYAADVLAETEDLQATLLEEMKARIPATEESVPVPDGPWLYNRRFERGAQYPLHVRTPRPASEEPATEGQEQETAGPEEILLDVTARAQGHDFYSLGGAAVSDDHGLYAFSEDTQGSEVFRIHLKDLTNKDQATDAMLWGEEAGPGQPGPVESSTGAFAFSPDSEWLFWIWRDDNGRPARLYRRRTRPQPGEPLEDILVYEETDPGFFLNLSVSASRQWIMLERGDHDTNETLLIPAADPQAAPVSFAPLVRGERYSLTHWGDCFIILTNRAEPGASSPGQAVDFTLMQAPDRPTPQQEWTPFLPQAPGHFLLQVSAGRDFLAWSERFEGNERIYVLARKDALALRPAENGSPSEGGPDLREIARSVQMDEPAYDLTLLGILEYDRPVLRYVYQSPTTPPHWYDLNIETGARILRKVRDVPSGHDPQAYETRRLFAPARDGEMVPITVLMKRGTKLDGSAPLLLYGYGSYGISMEAAFSTTTLSLVDRGWIHAIAHVRGGSEKGWNWFLEGRGRKKPNTFTDFIAVARHLITEGYTSPRRIVAHGGSAGGLLMGAVTNMAPELFAGIAAQVPFVDMLNTMSDTSLPLTPPEWPEWGNPLTDPEAYALIASYSPYDNVRQADYPAILAMGGLSDPRVTYWEPAKWIARLRDIAQGGPFLCRINMEAGHGGSSGRYTRLKEVALVQAFALWCLKQSK